MGKKKKKMKKKKTIVERALEAFAGEQRFKRGKRASTKIERQKRKPMKKRFGG